MNRLTTTRLAAATLTAAGLLWLGPAPGTPAATKVWSGAPGGLFVTDANWVGGVAPVNDLTTDIAQFDGTATAGTVGLTATRSVNGLTFGTAGWLLDGSGGNYTFSVGASGINSSGAGTNRINNKVTLGATQTWTIGAGNTLHLMDNPVTRYGLDMAGYGLNLTGGGTVKIESYYLNPGAGTPAITLGGGTAVEFATTGWGSQNLKGLTVAGSGTVRYSGNQAAYPGSNSYVGPTIAAGYVVLDNATMAANAFGAGDGTDATAVTLNPGGTIGLYAANTTVAGHKLVINANRSQGGLYVDTAATGSAWTGDVVFNVDDSGITVNAPDFTLGRAGGTITFTQGNRPNFRVNNPGTLTIDSKITGSLNPTDWWRSVEWNLYGATGVTIQLNAANDFVGNCHVVSGTTIKAGAIDAFSPGGDWWNQADGAIMDLNGFNQTVGRFETNGAATNTKAYLRGATLTITGYSYTIAGGQNPYAGVISDGPGYVGPSGSVRINLTNDLGCVQFDGANTFTGGITIDRGYLKLNTAAGAGSNTIYLNNNGGLTGSATLANSIVLGGGGTANISGLTLNGQISGSSPLNIASATINGNNTYTGTTTLGNYSTVKVGHANALNNNDVVLGTGAKLDLNGIAGVLVRSITNPNCTITSSLPGASLILGTGTSGNYSNGASGIITQDAGGSLALIWAGTGRFELNNQPGYKEGTFVTNGGVVSAAGDSYLGATYNAGTAPNSYITLSNGGGVYFWNGGNITRPIVLGRGGGVIYASQNNGTVGSVLPISGTGPLTVSTWTGNANGTLVFRDTTSTYSGDTHINNLGTGSLSVSAQLTGSGTVIQSFGDSTAAPRTLHFGGGYRSSLSVRADGDGTTGAQSIYLGSAANPYNLDLASSATIPVGYYSVSGRQNKTFVFGTVALANGAVLENSYAANDYANGDKLSFGKVYLKSGGGTLDMHWRDWTFRDGATVDDSVAAGTTTTLTLDGGNGNQRYPVGYFNGVISDNASDASKKLALVVNNTRTYTTWYITGDNTYTGGTTVNNGGTGNNAARLYVQNTGATDVLQGFGTGPVTLQSYSGSAYSNLYLQANGSASGATIATGNDLKVGLAPGGTSATSYLTVDRYNGTNTGGTFAMGALSFDAGAGLGVTGNNGYGLSFTSLSIPDTVTTTLSTTAPITVSGTGTPSTGRLSITGGATTINLNAAAAWTGGTSVLTKTVKIGHAGALAGAAGTGPVTINGTTLDATSNAGTPTAGILLGNLTWTNVNVLTSSGALGGGFILGNGTNYNLSLNTANSITGTAAITWNSTGTLGIGAANTYSGGTTINSGIVQTGNTAAALGTGKITIGAGRLFWYQTNTETNLITLTSASSQIQGYWNAFAGNIDGPGTLNVHIPDGNYYTVFTGNNTHLGGTTLTNSGTWAVFQNPAATNSVPALSTGTLTLTGTGSGGGLAQIQANGSGSSQTITVGNGAAVPVAVTGGTGNNLYATRKDGGNTGNTFAFGTLSLGGGAAVTIGGTNALGNKTSFAGISLLTGGGTIGGNNTGGNFNTVLVPAGGTITVDNSVATGTTTTLTIEGGNSQNGALADVYAANVLDNGTRKIAINVRSQNYGYRGSVYLTGTNAFTGGFSVYGDATNQLRVYAQDTTTTNNYLTAAGQGAITLYGKGTSQYPYLNLNANGSGSGQTINVGDATTKADLNVRMGPGGTAGAYTYLFADRYNGTNTGNTFAFGQLAMEDSLWLNVGAGNSYGVSFTGLSLGSTGATINGWTGSPTVTITGTGTTPSTGTLTVSGAGTVYLNGAAAYTGGTRRAGGYLSLGHADAVGGVLGQSIGTAGIIYLNAPQINVRGLETFAGPGQYPYITSSYSGGTATLNIDVPTGETYTYRAHIRDTGAQVVGLVKNGEGTQIIRDNNGQYNGYTGGTVLNAGELIFDSRNVPGGVFTFNGGILGYQQFTDTPNNNLAAASYNWSTFNGGIDVVTAGQTVTLNGLGGNGAFQKLGLGLLRFNAASYSGFSGLMTVAAGTLDVNGQTVAAGGLAGSGTVNNAAAGAASLTLSGIGSSVSTFAGSLTNSGGALALTNTGGTQILSGTNSYTGVTTVSGGMLQFARTASLYNGGTGSWTAGNLNVKSGATLAFNVGGPGEFGTGDVTTLLTNLAASSGPTNGMNAGSILGFDTTNAAGGSFTIADALLDTTGGGGGARGLTKLGNNTLVLTGGSTYTGPTSVQAGSLLVAAPGSLNGTAAVTVAGGATLGGTGTITTAGGVTATGADAATRAAVSPGMSIGTLTVVGDVTLADYSSLITELGGAGDSDLLAVTGTLDLGSSSDRLDLWLPTGTWMNGIYTVATFGAVNGAFNEIYLNGVPVADYIGGNYWTVYGPTSLTLVPEPTAGLLLALAAVPLLRRRR